MKEHSYKDCLPDRRWQLVLLVAFILMGFAYFTISCKTMKGKEHKPSKEINKGMLSILDDALESFAKSHNAQVESPKSKYYPPVDFLPDERQVSWVEGGIAKAIMIQPHQSNRVFKPDAWDFNVIAWNKDAQSFEKPLKLVSLLKTRAGWEGQIITSLPNPAQAERGRRPVPVLAFMALTQVIPMQ